MKRIIYLILFNLSATLIIVSTTFSGCTKEGPMGPAGADGSDGENGQDANITCGVCHDNSSDIAAATLQWGSSVHATGGNFERNGTTCAHCHTTEGFKEAIANGTRGTAAPISNPTPPGCRACHKIHTNYDESDFDLLTTADVTLDIAGSTTVSFGEGNLCANCHQPRVPDPKPTMGGSNNHTVSSPYWGPHYGSQAVIMGGAGAYEVGTGYPEPTNGHHGANCVDCHMGEAYGDQAGGHTMKMSYQYHGQATPNLASCESCHSSIESFDHLGVQTEIEGLLADLENELLNQSMIDGSGHIAPSFGTFTDNQLGVVMNYIILEHDGSKGIHNYAYTKKLLENSIAEAQSW